MTKMYLLLALLVIGPAWAEAELFDDSALSAALATPGSSSVSDRNLGSIEPAAGVAAEAARDLQRDVGSQIIVDTAEKPRPHADGEAPAKGEAKEGHKGEASPPPAEAPAAEGGAHGAEGAADGEAEKPKKKSSKKEPEPAFPTVTIGGKMVVTHAMQVADDVSASTPAGLRAKGMDQVLANRANIVPYAHNPMRGALDAPVQVVLFEDLSCVPCMASLGKIDAALADYASKTLVVYVHTPSKSYQDTNLPAFYGKVAQRFGKFWDYRAALIGANSADDKVIFDLLLKTGVKEREVRTLVMNDSRRFYRELDADVTLARNFAVGKPPVVFVNGIRLGSGGLPLERLGDVLSYVTERLRRGLPEPGP